MDSLLEIDICFDVAIYRLYSNPEKQQNNKQLAPASRAGRRSVLGRQELVQVLVDVLDVGAAQAQVVLQILHRARRDKRLWVLAGGGGKYAPHAQ